MGDAIAAEREARSCVEEKAFSTKERERERAARAPRGDVLCLKAAVGVGRAGDLARRLALSRRAARARPRGEKKRSVPLTRLDSREIQTLHFENGASRDLGDDLQRELRKSVAVSRGCLQSTFSQKVRPTLGYRRVGADAAQLAVRSARAASLGRDTQIFSQFFSRKERSTAGEYPLLIHEPPQVLGCVSLPLVASYPLAKRFNPVPRAAGALHLGNNLVDIPSRDSKDASRDLRPDRICSIELSCGFSKHSQSSESFFPQDLAFNTV